jgi:Ulp1 family protease
MELKIYDSSSYRKCTYGYAITAIRNFKKRLGYEKLPLVVKKMTVPQQGNTLRCGFFVLRFIYLLIRENSYLWLI